MKILVAVLCTLILVQETKCAKILGVFPIHAKSHYFLGSSLMRGLAEKGHDVTVLNTFGEKNPPKNGSYRDIILTSEMTQDGVGKVDFKIVTLNDDNE